MSKSIFAGTLGSAFLLSLSIGLLAAPGSANAGFLEQLFGTESAAPVPAQPSNAPDQPPAFYQDLPRQVARPKKRVVVDEKPKLQKPTDLMHDATLRPGDAVMMKDGIHIYSGRDDDGEHTRREFKPIDAARGISKQERVALLAMDTTRNDPLRQGSAPDTVASGRSAAVATPVVAGQTIVDARGKTVRYIGP